MGSSRCVFVLGVIVGLLVAVWRHQAVTPAAAFERSSSTSHAVGIADTSTSSVYYGNCAEARAAGAAPIYWGQPGYRPPLDRDNDGVACEPYLPR
jgi:hypothetical protein